MQIYRFNENPIITPLDVPPLHENHEVIGAFNAGVAEYKGETILLLRVAERPLSDNANIVRAPVYNIENQKLDLIEFNVHDNLYDFNDPRMIRNKTHLSGFDYLTSLSYIRIARSRDGRNFDIDEGAFIYPFNEYQTFGIEDARCTQIEGKYYINFTSVSPKGVVDSLVVTKDFETFESLGNIFAPDNKDILIFPEKINGKYYALHRPISSNLNKMDVWLASSPDLISWGEHKHLLNTSADDWDNGRVGGGLVPIKTHKGWLEIYHGATKDNRYCMGAILLDLEEPAKVIAKSKKPIMTPEASYEKEGFFGDVIFGCGGIVKGDELTMYYGVSDTSMAGCTMKISEILDQLILTV
jgi:predicted GH43/DUF377 family glycosyl hydrolase